MITSNYMIFLHNYHKMQFRTPPRMSRRVIRGPTRYVRRTTYLRRSLGRALTAGRMLRALGAPPMKHIISRPGNIIRVNDNGTSVQINGQVASNSGLQQGMFSDGRSLGQLFNTIKFGLSQIFQFGFLQTPGDLAGLYDNYRIKAVKLRFDLSFNNAASSGGTTNLHFTSMPMLHYAIDPDDITCPTDENAVLQYSKSRTVRLGDGPVFITLQPRAQGSAASNVSTGVSNGLPNTVAISNMMSPNTWFDCQNGLTIPHFGMKYFIEHMPIGTVTTGQTNWMLTISPTYILEMKNIH